MIPVQAPIGFWATVKRKLASLFGIPDKAVFVPAERPAHSPRGEHRGERHDRGDRGQRGGRGRGDFRGGRGGDRGGDRGGRGGDRGGRGGDRGPRGDRNGPREG